MSIRKDKISFVILSNFSLRNQVFSVWLIYRRYNNLWKKLNFKKRYWHKDNAIKTTTKGIGRYSNQNGKIFDFSRRKLSKARFLHVFRHISRNYWNNSLLSLS